MNGTLDIWDLMVKHAEPTLSGTNLSKFEKELKQQNLEKITDCALRSLRVQEAGSRMAVGDAEGTVTMLKLSDALSQLQKDEKQVSGALFEREMRREKVLEARARELKLKEREKNKPKVEEEG